MFFLELLGAPPAGCRVDTLKCVSLKEKNSKGLDSYTFPDSRDAHA